MIQIPLINEDIFIIGKYVDSPKKENILINLINKLKVFNIPILLTGHYPVKSEIQKMADFYLFDEENPALYKYEFQKYDLICSKLKIYNGIRTQEEYYRNNHDHFYMEDTFYRYLNEMTSNTYITKYKSIGNDIGLCGRTDNDELSVFLLCDDQKNLYANFRTNENRRGQE